MARLDGKVCIVTGAASGIGAETVRRFKEEGATVVGVDLREDSPGADLALACDVADEDAVRGMFDAVRAEYDSIDVLFNNAGISPPEDASVLETETDVWDRVQDVNVKSVFFCCKHGIPNLQQKKTDFRLTLMTRSQTSVSVSSTEASSIGEMPALLNSTLICPNSACASA